MMRLKYAVSYATLVLLAASLVVLARQPDADRAAAESQTTAAAANTVRPNVVLISLDTLRPDHLGCYGYDRPTSVNLDRLAGQGVVFRKTWAQAPWTLPSHMSLFTSRPPSRHRVDSINRVLPDGIVSLPGVLQANGYRTAALVNNGQMRSHWGFDRGFDVWREFQVDTPEGNCEQLTRNAAAWLERQHADEPFFLFLHYYDAHDAYAAPETFRRRFRTPLDGEDSRALAWRARFPNQSIGDPQLKQQLIGAYDAEIAWLDDALGKLFAAVPENTIVVVFSDHGEAFEEHGWTLHGATLYEEETRVALIMRLPNSEFAGRVVDQPATLMDVAPTILRQCGAAVPGEFEGVDLAPAIEGERLPARIVTSETKAVLEGAMRRTAIAFPWKLIVSEPDGACELYRLPDETTNLAASEPDAVAALKQHMAGRLAREDYWVVQARGPGKHEITLEVDDGRFALFIPHELERDRDTIQTSQDGRRIHWVTYPGDAGKSLYVELSRPGATLSLDVVRDDVRRPEQVYIGREARNPAGLPCRLPRDNPLRPILDQSALRESDGVLAVHFEGEGDGSDPGEDNTKAIDDEVLRQLRSLGYVE